MCAAVAAGTLPLEHFQPLLPFPGAVGASGGWEPGPTAVKDGIGSRTLHRGACARVWAAGNVYNRCVDLARPGCSTNLSACLLREPCPWEVLAESTQWSPLLAVKQPTHHIRIATTHGIPCM